jgi:hypothetical protein
MLWGLCQRCVLPCRSARLTRAASTPGHRCRLRGRRVKRGRRWQHRSALTGSAVQPRKGAHDGAQHDEQRKVLRKRRQRSALPARAADAVASRLRCARQRSVAMADGRRRTEEFQRKWSSRWTYMSLQRGRREHSRRWIASCPRTRRSRASAGLRAASAGVDKLQAAALTVVYVAHARHDEEGQVLQQRCERGSQHDSTRPRTCRNQPMPASLPTKRNWLKSVGLRSAWRRCMRPRYHASTSTTVRGVSSCRGWQRQGDSQTKRLVVEPHQMTGLPTLRNGQHVPRL